MKKPDDNSKKLIKNIVSLVTSALVLIAATFAWFTHGSEVGVESVKADFESKFSVDYAMALLDENDVLWDLDADGELCIRSESGLTKFSEYVSGLADSDWTATDSSKMAVETLYPGEFRIYRLSFGAINSHQHRLRIQLKSDVLANTDVTKSIYVGGYIVSQSDSGSSTDVSTKSLEELFRTTPGSPEKVEDVVAMTISAGDSADVYYLVGIPGTDINHTHDAIRTTGATVLFDAVEVV